MSTAIVEQLDADQLREKIADCDKQIRYWKDRADNAGFERRWGSLNAQTARHHQGHYEEQRLELIEQLRAFGEEYTGPPTHSYEFDVTESRRPGWGIQLHATPVSPRCTHSVEALSESEAKQLAIRDHKENCLKGQSK